jgi:hypothetical protein
LTAHHAILTVKTMEVHFNNPELQAKVEQWVADTGRPAEELLEDAMAGYFEELAQVRETLDRRYDDIKSGRVKLIPGDEARARLIERIDSHRKP